MNHWLIIGCGYVGLRVAKTVLARGDRVSAVTRSEPRGNQLCALGITPIIADVADPGSLQALPEADVWLHAVAFDRASPLPRRAVTVDGLRSVLDIAIGRAKRFLHLSTASVYGTADGSWVDERTPCEPTTESGQLALEAEQLVSDYHSQVEESHSFASILRLAGIYGPDRLIARIDQLREQAVLPGTGDSWLNLIHVDDIVQVVERVAKLEHPSELYLVSDDQPLTRREFYSEVARLMDTPLPCFECDADASRDNVAPNISNGRTQGLNKRCRNTKIREELKIELIHPTIRSGLPASF